MNHRAQITLWCPCGGTPRCRGLCSRCYFDWLENHNRFAGLRDKAFKRDGYRCTNCGGVEIIEHHRANDKLTLDKITTLCVRCHPKVHRTLRPKYGRLSPWLRKLWREQHPDLAEQVEFPFEAAPPAPEQAPLFSLAAAA